MGKKNKKEKGRGAEKTAQKMMKKQKGKKGEDTEDLEAMIAEFKQADKMKTTYHEEKTSHPSPRSNMSFCAHPEKDELILFGGEYFNGKKTFMYNEMFVYNLKRGDWSKRFAPNPPPPRCAHQAVAVAKEGGQMWVFGGEFSSPNNSQFYHYKDLWVLSLKEHVWRQVKAANGPSPRSGHRMCHFNKNLFVFGGFHETSRDFLYFNDCYMFNLAESVWSKIAAAGTGPSPRSACQLAVAPTGILVVGGYSKTRVKKDVEKGTAHADMFLLSTEPNSKYKWKQVKETGQKPWPRSGYSLAQISQNRSVMFGGVRDEDLEENLESQFFNSMSCLDVISHRWFNFDLRHARGESSSSEDDGMDHDGQLAAGSSTAGNFSVPCPRMNAAVAVKKHNMFIYGGMVEQDSRQITLNDLWSIDVKKVDAWKELVKSDDTATDWQEEGSDADSDGDDDDSDDDETGGGECSKSSGIDWSNTDVTLPTVRANDSLPSFWFRTREDWLELISDNLVCDGSDEMRRADDIAASAEKQARLHFERERQHDEPQNDEQQNDEPQNDEPKEE